MTPSRANNEIAVLVVDDDALDRRAVHRLIGKDYLLLEAATGAQALEILQSDPPDCVLLDYKIPGTDTFTLLAACVEQQVAVVMLTGTGNEAIAVEALQQGTQDYMTKDRVTKEALVHAVTNAIEKVELKRQLMEQQQELEDFVSLAAHDLKSPLRTITSMCQLVQHLTQDTLEAEVQTYLNDAVSHAIDLTHLLDDLLEYTRVSRSQKPFEAVDLNDTVHQVLSALDSVVQESHAIVEVDPLPTVQGDRTALFQLLQNLIANALKFRGERVPRVNIFSSSQGNLCQISIRDNGIGIAPQDHDQIFAPLKRLHTKTEYDGTGLGLTLCAKIVKQHGGRIWIESELGKGCLFSFSIPIS